MKFASCFGVLVLALSPSLRAQVAVGEGSPWTFGASGIVDAASSLRGGRENGHSLGALGSAHAAWSGPQIGGAIKLDAYASVLVLAGRGPTETFAGNFLTASNIEAHHGPRVYSWWVEATTPSWSLRVGSLLADEEFGTTEVGGNFANSAFGWPAFLSADTVNTGPAFYVPVLGARLRRSFGESQFIQIGIYDGDSFDQQTTDAESRTYGTHYQLNQTQGAFAMLEASFPVGSTQVEIGAWLHTARFDDVFADGSGRSFALTGAAPRSHRGNHGAYASIERTLAGAAGKSGHLAVHLRGGLAPSDRNRIGWAIDSGLAWRGPLTGRPADIFSLGYAHAKQGTRFAQRQRDAAPGETAPDFESVIEAGYAAKLSDHFTLRPSLQFIRHPGGSPAQRDALMALVRFEARY